jgi:cell division protein FtsX
MAVVHAWLRVDLRRRWRSLAVLALLIAVAGGTIMAALAGARRQASAPERLYDRTLPAVAAILANTPGFDWDKIRALPEVAVLSTFGPGYPIEGLGNQTADLAIGPEMLSTIERPVRYTGRLPDPARADEALVTRGFVSHHHLGVGDDVFVVLPTPQEQEAHGGSGPHGAMTGPRLRIRIVGVAASPWFSDEPGKKGLMLLSAGVAAKYPANAVGNVRPGGTGVVNALVRLRGGQAAIPQLRSDLAKAAGRPDVDVWDLPEQLGKPAQRQATFEARCLLAFAAAALLAAIFLIGQAIVRYAAASTGELQTLRALGMTPRQATATAAAGPAIVGVLGAVLAAGVAFVASRWFPIGTAATLEPSPGWSFDAVVLAPGVALLAVLVAVAAATAARLALGAGRRNVPARRSAVASTVARGGLAVPVVIGTRFALEAGRGRSSVPVRPALIGAVTGVLGILAAFTFSQGVTDASNHPERFGQTFHLSAFMGNNGQTYGPADKLTSALRADPDVTGVNDARISVATGPRGSGSVTLYSYNGGRKPLDVVVTRGRMPRLADEILLAPQSMAGLHVAMDQTVALTGNKGTRTLKVVGAGLVPNGFHNNYADGGWLSDAGYDSLFRGHKFRLEYVALRPGARTPHAGEALTAYVTKVDPALAAFPFEQPETLAQVYELRQVRGLPIVLGLFLALLAVGAVGHALATAVRRRSHDLAVLRALGMTQWQSRWVVVTQATVLALVGLTFGVPLGLAVGRTVWRAVSDYTPIQYVPPTAVWTLWLVGPAALVIANALAAWPGRRAARMRISHILRTE